MNDELQSTNDELQLTNEQLTDRSFAVTQLNEFMQSIFNSLEAAVIVVNRELMVQVWGGQAEDLWGLREDETVGQRLLSLDSGLPAQTLRPWLLAAMSPEPGGGTYRQHITAVNRRGREVDLRVTVTPMRHGSADTSQEPTGALLLFEQLSSDDLNGDTRV